MKIDIKETIIIDITDKFFIQFNSDWGQLFSRQNWYTANFLKVYFENDKMTGSAEFEVYILGFGLRFVYNYDFDNSIAGKRFKELSTELGIAEK